MPALYVSHSNFMNLSSGLGLRVVRHLRALLIRKQPGIAQRRSFYCIVVVIGRQAPEKSKEAPHSRTQEHNNLGGKPFAKKRVCSSKTPFVGTQCQ